MAELTVMQSLAFKEAYLTLAPRYERATGHRISTLWVPTAKVVATVERGEAADLVIIAAAVVDELIAKGLARERIDLATCGVAVAVKAGAPRPDLSSAESLKRAVLGAKSIVYSRGPSGVYLDGLFRRMGISGELEHKLTRVQGEPSGEVVARGFAEIGFQQMSELLPVAGIDVVGPLPAEIQEITTFAATVLAKAREPQAAREVIDYLGTEDAKAVIRATGMEPV
ncbi:MAG TPA: substrate-binding domain-containing protein [Burkholderiales bacterium]|nr:substrate-binding domain-containing protein [Burkholderiales bacterium]